MGQPQHLHHVTDTHHVRHRHHVPAREVADKDGAAVIENEFEFVCVVLLAMLNLVGDADARAVVDDGLCDAPAAVTPLAPAALPGLDPLADTLPTSDLERKVDAADSDGGCSEAVVEPDTGARDGVDGLPSSTANRRCWLGRWLAASAVVAEVCSRRRSGHCSVPAVTRESRSLGTGEGTAGPGSALVASCLAVSGNGILSPPPMGSLGAVLDFSACCSLTATTPSSE